MNRDLPEQIRDVDFLANTMKKTKTVGGASRLDKMNIYFVYMIFKVAILPLLYLIDFCQLTNDNDCQGPHFVPR